MTPRELKHFLDLLSLSNSQICQEIGCKPYELSQTLSGDRRNPDIRTRLATFVGHPEEKLFGADFDAAVQARKTA